MIELLRAVDEWLTAAHAAKATCLNPEEFDVVIRHYELWRDMLRSLSQ